MTSHATRPQTTPKKPKPHRNFSVLTWPAWLRVLAVLPALVALWLGVAWANAAVDATVTGML